MSEWRFKVTKEHGVLTDSAAAALGVIIGVLVIFCVGAILVLLDLECTNADARWFCTVELR